MPRLPKMIAFVALLISGLVTASCAQQSSPESHGALMGGNMMNSGGAMGCGMMGGGSMMCQGSGNPMDGQGGMMGMHPDGSGSQMMDMNRMMTQMSQMMDRCDAMMKDHKMSPSGHGGDSHQ